MSGHGAGGRLDARHAGSDPFFACVDAWLPLQDVAVTLGVTPDHLPAPDSCGLCYEARRGECLIWMDGLARYHVRGGTEMTVQMSAGADPSAVAHCLLGTPLAALLYQRGHLLLNGSCVETSNGALMLVATSGVGASTLAAALCLGGARLVSDGFCAVAEGDAPQALAGPPYLRLAADSIVQLGLDPTRYAPIRAGLDRHVVPLPGAAGAANLRAICALAADGGDRLKFERLPPARRLLALEQKVHRPHLARPLLGPRRYFERLAWLAAHADVRRACRPRRGFDPQAWATSLSRELADK